MKIVVKYKKYFAYGTEVVLPLEVSEDWLVSDLKKIVRGHTNVEVEHQELYVRQYGDFKEMLDNNSLGFY